MTDYRITPSLEEQFALERRAARYAMTVEDYLGFVISHHALGRLLPSPPSAARQKETQTEKRARLRALSPSGKSPYTEAIEILTRKAPTA